MRRSSSPDHPQVEEDHPSVGPAQVARVRVGVEEPGAQDLLQEGLHELARRLHPDLARRRLAERDAAHLLHHQQPAARQLAVGPRHRQPVERPHDQRQPLEGLGLELVVELALQRGREVLEHRRQVGDLLEQRAGAWPARRTAAGAPGPAGSAARRTAAAP